MRLACLFALLAIVNSSFQSSRLFELVDQNKDDFASPEELRSFACSFGKQCRTSIESLEFAMKRLDSDENGLLSEKELMGSLLENVRDPIDP